MATGNNTQQNISINVQTNASQASGQVNALVTSTTSLTTATSATTLSQAELVRQLDAANNALIALRASGTATTAQLQAATTQVTSLNGQLASTAAAIPQANAAPTFNRFAAGANLAAGATQGVVSGLALIGIEGENVGETLLKVQAASAFADSIASITEMGDQIGGLRDTVVGVYRSFQVARTAATAATVASTAATLTSTAATTASTAATVGATAATGGLTTATSILNAVMAANPIGAVITVVVALIAAIAALGFGVYKLVKYFQDHNSASDKLRVTTKAVTKEVKDQNESILKGREARDIRLKQEYAMAEASGKSAEELRKLRLAQNEQIVSEERSQALRAQSILLSARKAKEEAIANGASEESIKELDAVYKVAYESFKAINDNYKSVLKDRTTEENAQLVEIRREQTEHAKEVAEKAKEAADKAREEAKARYKERLDAQKKYQEESEAALKDFQAKVRQAEADQWKQDFDAQVAKDELLASYKSQTELEKLEAQEEIDRAILDQANATQEERLELTAHYLDERNRIESEANIKADEAKKALLDKEVADKEAVREAKNAIQNAEIDVATQGITALKGIFEKNKGMQKALLIAENAAGIAKIAINTATAVSKAVAASPTTGGAPFSAISIASGAIGIASAVAATAKGLKALGGGGSAEGSSSPMTAPTASSGTPQVEFQAPGASQVGGTVSQARNEVAPIKTYVVASDMTNQQQLDQKAKDANTI
jgi:hypothetical protein